MLDKTRQNVHPVSGVVTTTREGRVTHALSTRRFDANPQTRSIPNKDAREKTKVSIYMAW